MGLRLGLGENGLALPCGNTISTFNHFNPSGADVWKVRLDGKLP